MVFIDWMKVLSFVVVVVVGDGAAVVVAANPDPDPLRKGKDKK